jgi:hypothetical protein
MKKSLLMYAYRARSSTARWRPICWGKVCCFILPKYMSVEKRYYVDPVLSGIEVGASPIEDYSGSMKIGMGC